MHQYKDFLRQLKQQNLLRSLREIDSAPDDIITENGKELLLFSSNNYLGLANHPSLKSAAIAAIQGWGVGSGASRLVSGNLNLYKQLEEALAKLKKTEAALVFSTGYMANIGSLGAILQKDDLILADRLNHASLIDGCRLSGATFRLYKHCDMDHLKKLLSDRKKDQKAFIITDGLFSMDGDIAPLPEILRLAEEYDVGVFLDDAHATGVLGSFGGGTAEHFQLTSPRLIQMGTLSKALGGLGGFIAGNRILIDYLINKARPFVYTTALPPSVLASGIAALALLEKDQTLIKQLWENRNYFYEKVSHLGFNTLKTESPIFPILIGNSETALTFSKSLLENGIHVSAIRPPTVPKGTARLRVTIMANHKKHQIDTLLYQLEKAGRSLKVI